MKIKVGDWVNWEGMVTRVLSIQDDMAELYTGNGQRCEYLENITNIPIKFKAINFDELELWHYACAFKYIRQDTGFMERWCFSVTRDSDKEYRVLIKKQGGKYLELCETLPSIDKANEWANLQYATLLAKARRLV